MATNNITGTHWKVKQTPGMDAMHYAFIITPGTHYTRTSHHVAGVVLPISGFGLWWVSAARFATRAVYICVSFFGTPRGT